MRRSTLMAVVSLFLAGGLAAQQEEEAPAPMIAASYYQCAPDEVQPIIDAWSQAFQQLQDQGLLLGWGVLQHAWADEWNLVAYRTVTDLSALQASLEAQGPIMESVDPDLPAKMQAACNGMHKDNIYWVAAASQPGGD